MEVGDQTESQQERLQQVIDRYQTTFCDYFVLYQVAESKIILILTTDDKPFGVPH